MDAKKIAALVGAGVAVVCVLFVVALLLIKTLWAWTVPDLCPGAVQQGLVAGTISWFTAMKLALFVAVLGGVARGNESCHVSTA